MRPLGGSKRERHEVMADAPFSRSDPSPTHSATESATDRALPQTFGRYTLFEQIGKGGMAEIFLARERTELGATRLSVVKRILPVFADDRRFSEMLIHEAKLAARLSHRCIVQVFDLGRQGAPREAGEAGEAGEAEGAAADDRLFIAMEYVEGFDLSALLRRATERGVALPVEFALGIVADVLEGLDYAHRRTDEDGRPLGIVHRDVSPSNVLVSCEGEVKLCDFGIAHANALVREEIREEVSEALKGKAGYMSPEHARGEVLDARADVFAAGILLWELLSGRRLYRSTADLPLLEQARRAEIPPLRPLDVPRFSELERIVRRALAADKDERYASAAAFSRDLEEYVASASLVTSSLRLRGFLNENFDEDFAARRRAVERHFPRPSEPSVTPRVALPPPLSIAPVSAGAMRAFKRQLEAHDAMQVDFAPLEALDPADAVEVVVEDDDVVPPRASLARRAVFAVGALALAAALVAIVWAVVR